MAAAFAASEAGATVTLADEAPALGGQIYQQSRLEGVGDRDGWHRVRDRRGRSMIAAASAAGIDVLTDTVVSSIWDREALLCRHEVEVRRITAGAIVIAAGAYDRPMPFPGWTLPGVITAGAAQRLVKAAGVAPGRRILMAGSGPLSLAFAAELRHRGAGVIMLAEACRRPAVRSVLRLLSAARGNVPSLLDGIRYLRFLRGAGVPVRWSTMIARAEGRDGVERAVIVRVDDAWRPLPGSEEVLEVDTVCLGYGLVPSNELARLCGCAHTYDEARGGWVATRDAWMRSSVPGVFIAGDGAGISGAAVAVEEGRIAGLGAAVETGRLESGEAAARARPAHARLRRARRFAVALRDMYPVGEGMYGLADDLTVICRCEEVTLAEIKEALAASPADVQGVKDSTRAGMGLCQGRMCARQVAAEVAKTLRVPIASVAPPSVRPPVKPLPIAAVASEMAERRRPIVELES